MSSRTRLPTAERQRQIAEAALRIIATRGVRQLTAVALAAEVGIADGTIFRHFKSMEEVVEAAIDRFETALASTFPPEEGEALDRLGAFLVNRLKLVRQKPELMMLVFSGRLAEAGGEAGAVRVGKIVARSVHFLRDCLAEAQRRGEVSQDTPVMLLVWMVIGVIRGASGGGHGTPVDTGLGSEQPETVRRELERFLRRSGRP
ncbi:MAG: TetR/AcrR family transcriptional regulator [Planctomycetes bacterium]|nr:TetR/AcrR family transcriptional regulator [Planctomycetota bacterium]MBL7007690.1 TetR/AcrR family transcriptional regulator [Planctomycetota bacterium]